MKITLKLVTISQVIAMLLLTACLHSALADPPQADARQDAVGKKTVPLIVDYGDGVEKHFSRIAWHEAMTVQDVTVAATKQPHGIQIKQRGKKATAFLIQIDDLANQSRGRNWVYRVNGKLADRSFGVYAVKAGDVVRWTFQEYP